MGAIPRNVFSILAEIILETKAKTAVKYLKPNLIVKATVHSRGRNSTHIIFTIGKPNYAERKRIKAFLKAGEPFPVKKIRWR